MIRVRLWYVLPVDNVHANGKGGMWHLIFHTFPFELHAEIGWAGSDTGFQKWRGGSDNC